MFKPKKRSKKQSSIPHKKQKTFTPVYFYLGLSKNIWTHILAFLDTRTLFSTIPTLSTFFRYCTKNSHNMLQAAQVSLTLTKDLEKNKTVVEPEQTINFLRSSENLESLSIVIRNQGIIPSITETNPLIKILPSMPWASILQVLDLELLELNHSILKYFLNELKSLQKLSLTLGCEFPIELWYLFLRFVDSKRSSQSASIIPYNPLKELKISYKKYYFGSNPDLDFFKSLDENNDLESFSIQLNSKSPFYTTCNTYFLSNNRLRVLKLSSFFAFSQEHSKNFCKFLENNSSLQVVEVSETVMMDFSEFTNMVSSNLYLKSINLLPYMPDAGLSIRFSQIVLILKAMSLNKVKEFGLHTECFEISPSEMTQDTDPETAYIELSKKIFFEIENRFAGTRDLFRLYLKLENLPQSIRNTFMLMSSGYLKENGGNYFIFSKVSD